MSNLSDGGVMPNGEVSQPTTGPFDARLVAPIEAEIGRRQPPGQAPRHRGSEVWFLCPSHDDHHPSARWNGAKQTWYCDVCAAGGGATDLAARFGFSVSESRGGRRADRGTEPKAAGRIVAIYPYRDEAANLLFEVVRYEPKDFRQRRPDGRGGWVRNLSNVRRLPYRLPELLAADEDAIVFVPEGEADVERLRRIGLVATTNPGGAGNWRPEYAEHLRQRRVVVLPDNDSPGERHAGQVCRSLEGVAQAVTFLDLPGLATKGDVTDWLDGEGSATALLTLADAALRERPFAVAEADPAAPSGTAAHADIGMTRRLADAIAGSDHFAIDAGRKLYAFGNGVYRPDGTERVAKQIKALLNSWGESRVWSTYRVHKVAAYIATDAARLWGRPPRDEVSLLNGILNVTTGALRPHSPDFLSPIQLPVDFDANASCPAWERQFHETLPADAQGIVWEMLAWMLTSDQSIQRAVLLLGDGANGKSTLLRAITAFLGPENVSALPLHRMETNRFAAAQLVGKLANICPDLPSGGLTSTSVFKAITGGDSIVGEYKYKDSFAFVPHCKLVFSANHPPRSEDASPAFHQRWLVVPFERSFEGAAAVPSAELDARLSATVELSGALNHAITALAGLRTQGEFSATASLDAAWESFRSETDPIVGWLDRATITDSEILVTREALYRAYAGECTRAGRPPPSQRVFITVVRRQRPGLREERKMVSGRYVWCWLGLGLNAVSA